jgi:hypothetical protein
LVAFVDLRSRLRDAAYSAFVGGKAERDEAVEQTERDYIALVEAGAEAARLEASLASADREATARELDTAAIIITPGVSRLESRSARTRGTISASVLGHIGDTNRRIPKPAGGLEPPTPSLQVKCSTS